MVLVVRTPTRYASTAAASGSAGSTLASRAAASSASNSVTRASTASALTPPARIACNSGRCSPTSTMTSPVRHRCAPACSRRTRCIAGFCHALSAAVLRRMSVAWDCANPWYADGAAADRNAPRNARSASPAGANTS